MPKKTHGRPLSATRWRERTPRAAGRAGHAVDAVDTAVAVSVELKRKKSFERRWCTASGDNRYPSMAFERWWLSATLSSHGGDPLLPELRAENEVLSSDLQAVGFLPHEAQQLVQRLHSASAGLARHLRDAKMPSDEHVEVEFSDQGEVLLRSAGASVRLAAAAYQKLQKLYQMHCKKDTEDFKRAALVVALRYQSLGGTGFQLALPVSAWQVLEEDFEVEAECFASPFNCWFPSYCSAFPDSRLPALMLATLGISFVPGARPFRGSVSPRSLSSREAFPWDAEGNAKAERAWASLQKSYPNAVATGEYFGGECSKGTIISRYERLGQILGTDIALQMVEKEPILLLIDPSMQERSFRYLTNLEEESQKGLALETVQKNPRLLTVPDFEYERTKPSLASLSNTASAIDFLRPLGEVGLAVVIFSSFVAL
ncbi:mRNA (2'-O-methyladenosine-N(6)-)-methyltransferase (Cap-specific adenosine methyltransferase) (CAPAM) (Phosphorylated CTD-interacting factor 1), partial [Durusdinium trenchii]